MRDCLTSIILCTLFFMVPITYTKAGMIDKEGMKPWEICGLCHNLNGISRMSKFPKLAGQKAGYIEKQLRDFKTGKRENDGGQMSAIVTEITDDQIPIVAEYFSKLEASKPANIEIDKKSLLRAKLLFEKGDPQKGVQACITCHVKQNSQHSYAPILAAQHADYLFKQLNDFKESNRKNDKDNIMSDIAAKLTEYDIKILANYISTLRK